jgi:hypothetical protein
MICLPQDLTKKFLSALKSGEIDPQKLSDMTSDERRDFVGTIVGTDAAREVNALFESKLLLKDQQQGIVTWAKNVGGLSDVVQRDLVTRVNNLSAALDKADLKSFLTDYVSKKMGADVTDEEFQKITDMAKTAADAKDAIVPRKIGAPQTESEKVYGDASVKMANYVQELKDSNKPSLIDTAKERGIGKSALDGAMKVANVTKSLKASIEFTALFKQGFGTLMTHPTVWFGNGVDMFNNFFKTVGGGDAMNEIKSDIASRPNSINGYYAKMKLATGNVEEEFPSSLPSKIPVVGRVFKGSSMAFTGFQYENRADLADLYIEIAKKNGLDLDSSNSKTLPALGKMINSLTGRGSLGKAEAIGNEVNAAFFSPRLAMGSIQMLVAHPLGIGLEGDTFTQKQAAINLVKMIVGTSAVLVTANAIKPGSVNFNPISTNFGRIKVGDTTFNVSGGNAAIITLAARIATWKSESSTGKVTAINARTKTGAAVFGGATVGSVLETFMTDKLSPAASVVNDLWLTGDTFAGTKPTLGSELQNVAVPLQISGYEEIANDPKSANKLVAILANVLGVTISNVPTKAKK